MVAIAYTDLAEVTDITPRVAPQACAAKPQARVAKVQEFRPSGDPLIDAATRLLTVPVRQVYALLWRTGLLVVDS